MRKRFPIFDERSVKVRCSSDGPFKAYILCCCGYSIVVDLNEVDSLGGF